MPEKTKKRILFITQGNVDHASSRIRAHQYFPEFRTMGFQIHWIPRIPVRKESFIWTYMMFPFWKRVNKFRIYAAVLRCNFELLFIQRYFLPVWCLNYCKKRGRKILFDFDDAIYMSLSGSADFRKTADQIRFADRVVVSCHILQEWVKTQKKGAIVITSPVDTRIVHPRLAQNNKVVIGWMGSKWTSKYLIPLETVFRRIQEKFPVSFLFVGADPHLLPGFSAEYKVWELEKEPEWLAQMDIGIMPLTDGEFERAKGGFKIFQYMAAGMPALASPVGINTGIVEHGHTGFLCQTEEEWFIGLSRLTENSSLREEMGKNARMRVVEKYSLLVCFWQLLAVIEEVLTERGQRD